MLKVKSQKSKAEGQKWTMPQSMAFRACALCFCLVVIATDLSFGQKADTSDKVRINILNSKNFIFNHTDSGEYNKFIGDVVIEQGTDTLYCDSAYQNSTTKNFEAFGDVKIAQKEGTQGTSDYLRYTSNQKLAFMRGNVSLTDGKNNLKCTELTYDLGTKTAVYDKGGVLHNDSTTVTSNSGIYNVKSKEAHFKGNAIITDPQYKIWSDDMVYNTDTKVTEFYAKSTVVRDSGRGVLQTSNGSYDGKNGIAHFRGHSSIWNDGQYIEGDTLNYNKLTGYGLAIGHVVSIDTEHHSTMYCGWAQYKQKKRILLATVKPVLVQVNGKDTIYMRADTFYSAPMVRILPAVKSKKPDMKDSVRTGSSAPASPVSVKDSIAIVKKAGNNDSLMKAADTTDYTSLVPYVRTVPKQETAIVTETKKDAVVANVFPVPDVPPSPVDTIDVATMLKFPDIRRNPQWAIPSKKAVKTKKASRQSQRKNEPGMQNMVVEDTTSADSTAPLYFIGYHHVLIFSDSLQGKCDSVSYTRSDSTIRMIYNPVAWAHNSQVTGDTILLQLDSNQLRRMYVPNNAFMVSQSGPARAQLFDQVQGKTLTAYFKDNTITQMNVFPDAECIYYSKDEKNAYLGVMQSNSVRMRVYFDDKKIKTIRFDQDPHHKLSPLEQVDIPTTRLSRFKWIIEQRPKSKEELFQ